jgi:hypothetical protein
VPFESGATLFRSSDATTTAAAAAAAAATAAVASSESVLAKHFEASAKRGIVLSARQLADYARRRGLQSVP